MFNRDTEQMKNDLISFLSNCDTNIVHAHQIYRTTPFIKELLQKVADKTQPGIEITNVNKLNFNLNAEKAKSLLNRFAFFDRISGNAQMPATTSVSISSSATISTTITAPQISLESPGSPIARIGAEPNESISGSIAKPGLEVSMPGSPIASIETDKPKAVTPETVQFIPLPGSPIATMGILNPPTTSEEQPAVGSDPIIKKRQRPQPLSPADVMTQFLASNPNFKLSSSLPPSITLQPLLPPSTFSPQSSPELKKSKRTNPSETSTESTVPFNSIPISFYRPSINVKVHDVTELLNKKFPLKEDLKLTLIPMDQKIADSLGVKDEKLAWTKFRDGMARSLSGKKRAAAGLCKVLNIESKSYLLVAGNYEKYGEKTRKRIEYEETPIPFTINALLQEQTYKACEEFCQNANSHSASTIIKEATEEGYVSKERISLLPKELLDKRFDIKPFITPEQGFSVNNIPDISIVFVSSKSKAEAVLNLLQKENPDKTIGAKLYEGFLGKEYVYAIIADERYYHCSSEVYDFFNQDVLDPFPKELAQDFEREIKDHSKIGLIRHNLHKSLDLVVNQQPKARRKKKTNEQDNDLLTTEVTDGRPQVNDKSATLFAELKKMQMLKSSSPGEQEKSNELQNETNQNKIVEMELENVPEFPEPVEQVHENMPVLIPIQPVEPIEQISEKTLNEPKQVATDKISSDDKDIIDLPDILADLNLKASNSDLISMNAVKRLLSIVTVVKDPAKQSDIMKIINEEMAALRQPHQGKDEVLTITDLKRLRVTNEELSILKEVEHHFGLADSMLKSANKEREKYRKFLKTFKSRNYQQCINDYQQCVKDYQQCINTFYQAYICLCQLSVNDVNRNQLHSLKSLLIGKMEEAITRSCECKKEQQSRENSEIMNKKREQINQYVKEIRKNDKIEKKKPNLFKRSKAPTLFDPKYQFLIEDFEDKTLQTTPTEVQKKELKKTLTEEQIEDQIKGIQREQVFVQTEVRSSKNRLMSSGPNDIYNKINQRIITEVLSAEEQGLYLAKIAELTSTNKSNLGAQNLFSQDKKESDSHDSRSQKITSKGV